MKAKKQPGGLLGDKLKRQSKLRKIAFGIVALVALMIAGCYEHVSVKGTIAAGSTLAIVAGAAVVEKTDEEKLLDKIDVQVKSLLNGEKSATSLQLKGLEDQLKELKDKKPDNTALKDEVIRIAGELKSFKETAKQVEVKGLSIKDQLKNFATKNADRWNQFKKGEIKSLELELEIKAAATMLESSNLGGSAYLPKPEFVPGITDIARAQPLIEQYANTSNTSSAVIVWVNKTNPDGTVAMVAEGGLKPLIDFEFATETSTAKKAAAKIKVSTEMLEDFDFMASEINNELLYQVNSMVDAGLLTGTGLTIYLTGMTTLAGAYILTTLVTTDPSDTDAILAAATQIKTLNFNANYAFVNPIDAANMKLKKDSVGQYVIPPFVAADGMSVGGIKVIESNKITQGYVLVADMSKFIVRNYKPFFVSIGWTGDDFEKNLVTILGERRLHSYASDNNTGAFVYDTFANIKAAIAPAP